MRYALKVKKNPESSMMFEMDKKIKEQVLGGDNETVAKTTIRQKLAGLSAIALFLLLLVPSGSGQTVITMPIMAPLADLVGVTRLALAQVPWEKWAKFMFPLFMIWSGVGAIFLIIAQIIQWGPF